MVRAILNLTKTQSRRPLRKGTWFTEEHGVIRMVPTGLACTGFAPVACPYGATGDRLWVRETWQMVSGNDRARRVCENPQPDFGWVEYAATPRPDEPAYKWRPSIFMPRWVGRITLEITDIRVERLTEISEADALAEGIVQVFDGYGLPDGSHYHATDPRQSYFSLFEAINGPGAVEANEWLWVISFKRHTA